MLYKFYYNGSDIILLYEKHFVEENETKYDKGCKGKAFHSYSNSKVSRSVSVLFEENLNIELLKTIRICTLIGDISLGGRGPAYNGH